MVIGQDSKLEEFPVWNLNFKIGHNIQYNSRYTTGSQLTQDQIGVANQLLPHDHYCAISSDNSTDVAKWDE